MIFDCFSVPLHVSVAHVPAPEAEIGDVICGGACVREECDVVGDMGLALGWQGAVGGNT